jgi:hypothetical protein
MKLITGAGDVSDKHNNPDGKTMHGALAPACDGFVRSYA